MNESLIHYSQYLVVDCCNLLNYKTEESMGYNRHNSYEKNNISVD